MNHIKFSSDSLETKSEIHLLPCKIYFNGEAEVKSFFSSSITSSNTAKLVNGENGNFMFEIKYCVHYIQ
jgi:hypothetical protein